MVKTSPLWLLVKVIAIMYAATLAKLWLRQKWRARMWCPRSQKKKKLPISKTYNSNNWLLLPILRTKEGRKSKLSRKKCSRDFFFRFTGDLSQHINALEILRDKFGKFTDKYVIRNIFFFRFYNMYPISNQLNKLFRKKVYSAARFRDRPPLLISLDKT